MSGPIDQTADEFTISSGTTTFRRVYVGRGFVSGVQLVWKDATSAFSAPTLYTSCDANPAVPDDNGSADLEYWTEETSLSYDAVSANAKGSQMLHLGNNGGKWLLIEIAATADCDMAIKPHAKE